MIHTEQTARENIDKLLTAAGWDVQDASHVNIHAARGVAICEFPLKSGLELIDDQAWLADEPHNRNMAVASIINCIQ